MPQDVFLRVADSSCACSNPLIQSFKRIPGIVSSLLDRLASDDDDESAQSC